MCAMADRIMVVGGGVFNVRFVRACIIKRPLCCGGGGGKPHAAIDGGEIPITSVQRHFLTTFPAATHADLIPAATPLPFRVNHTRHYPCSFPMYHSTVLLLLTRHPSNITRLHRRLSGATTRRRLVTVAWNHRVHSRRSGSRRRLPMVVGKPRHQIIGTAVAGVVGVNIKTNILTLASSLVHQRLKRATRTCRLIIPRVLRTSTTTTAAAAVLNLPGYPRQPHPMHSQLPIFPCQLRHFILKPTPKKKKRKPKIQNPKIKIPIKKYLQKREKETEAEKITWERRRQRRMRSERGDGRRRRRAAVRRGPN